MICPKCKIEMKNGFCLKCGYMESGNMIQTESKNDKRYEDMKILNEDFDMMNRNENGLIAMLLGNFYLSYHGHLFTGLLLGLLDYLLFYLINVITSDFYFSFIIYFSIFFYLLVTRILYGIFLNIICIKLDELKIKIIKKIYKQNYKNKLGGYHKSIVYVFLNILIYVIIIVIFILVRRMKNGIL